MPTGSRRGWTFIDEAAAPDPESPRGEAVNARAAVLMDEWSRIHNAREQEAFKLAADREDGRGYEWEPGCACTEGFEQDPDGLCVHDRKEWYNLAETQKLKDAGERLRLELIEAELAGMGARKMRPYEHLAEDERWAQWQEEGRFGHYSE